MSKVYPKSIVAFINSNLTNIFDLDFFIIFLYKIAHEASLGAAARSVTVKPTGYGFDPHSWR